MKTIGYGIIGCGWVSPGHAVGVRSLRGRGVELVAVADAEGARARAMAEEYGAGHWYQDYRELLARDDVQMVSICVPPHLHREVAVDAARAGKQILCEKPLAPTVEEADAILEAVRSSGVQLSVVFQSRYDPAFRRLHHAARGGAFGEILLGQVLHKVMRTNLAVGSWHGRWSLSGGGVLMAQAIHLLDVLAWCLGPVESAAAAVATRVRAEEVEDTAAAALRFKSGAVGAVAATNVSDTRRLSRIEIHGTAGAAVVENGRFVLWQPAAGYQEPPPLDDEPALSEEDLRRLRFGTGHVKQVADFVARAREGLPQLATGEDGRHMTAVLQAIYESSRTGRCVPVPDVQKGKL